MVNTPLTEPAMTLPALIQAGAAATDLAAWIRSERTLLNRLAYQAGAVLLRGFSVGGAAGFGAVMDALSQDVLRYGERSSPRTEVSPGVYTSTEYPPSEHIRLHSEQSYTSDWPTRIVFYCEQPATSGGRTPLADTRQVLARLSQPTADRFGQAGIRYLRNYLPGISLSWQEAFQTDSRSEVEAYCARADITAEWVAHNHLRTWQVRPAIRAHPVTGDRTWFNHAAFFHVSSLPEEVRFGLLDVLPAEDLPYNTYYGDGAVIEGETLEEIRAAYAAATTGFDWRAGDVLVVENMIAAHGREPFEGQRRVLVAMSDPITRFEATR
jgi:alpha-ketoglutarate-dependent taurine dioxygenase